MSRLPATAFTQARSFRTGYVLTWFLAKPEQFASFSHIVIDEASIMSIWAWRATWNDHDWLCNYVHSCTLSLFQGVSLVDKCFSFDTLNIPEPIWTDQHHSLSGPWAWCGHGTLPPLDKAADVFLPSPQGRSCDRCRTAQALWAWQVILMSATMQPDEFRATPRVSRCCRLTRSCCWPAANLRWLLLWFRSRRASYCVGFLNLSLLGRVP